METARKIARTEGRLPNGGIVQLSGRTNSELHDSALAVGCASYRDFYGELIANLRGEWIAMRW